MNVASYFDNERINPSEMMELHYYVECHYMFWIHFNQMDAGEIL